MSTIIAADYFFLQPTKIVLFFPVAKSQLALALPATQEVGRNRAPVHAATFEPL